MATAEHCKRRIQQRLVKEVYQIKRHTDWVTSIAFSPDGTQIATGDRAGNLYLSSADSGGILLSLDSHKGSVRGLAWRSDSKVVASALRMTGG